MQFIRSELFHEDYTQNSSIWSLIKDVLDGKDALDSAGEIRLPRPLGRSDEEYEAYQKRAVLYNAAARTLDGLLGAIFRKDTIVEIPDGISYLLDDTDGQGSNITQFSKKATKDVVAFGRHGLLVDFPVATNIWTLADERNSGLKARIHNYCPQSIIMWNVTRRQGRLILTHVVLKEDVYESTGAHPLNRQRFHRYRLLELDEDGLYVIHILEESETTDPNNKYKKTTSYIPAETIIPTWPNGERLDFIPFYFIGSLANTANPDKAPLYDLCQMVLAHYRNSADFEEACFLLGQPTSYITGIDEDFIEANRGNIRWGSRATWLLPEGASAGILESTTDKNILQKAMEHKEIQMIGIGARLVMDNTSRGSESNESVLMRRSGEASQMSCIADNVSVAITKALKTAARWSGISDQEIETIIFRLNTDFFTTRLSHQDIKALVEAWQMGILPRKIVYDNLRKGEIVSSLYSDDQLDELINQEDGANISFKDSHDDMVNNSATNT